MSPITPLHGLWLVCAAWFSACSNHWGASSSEVATPGTPSPSDEPEVRAECQAEVMLERDASRRS
jgi:hypothetical protein